MEIKMFHLDDMTTIVQFSGDGDSPNWQKLRFSCVPRTCVGWWESSTGNNFYRERKMSARRKEPFERILLRLSEMYWSCLSVDEDEKQVYLSPIAEFDLSLHELRIYPKVRIKVKRNLNEPDRLLIGCCMTTVWQHAINVLLRSCQLYPPTSSVSLSNIVFFNEFDGFCMITEAFSNYLRNPPFLIDVYICQPTDNGDWLPCSKLSHTCRKRPEMSRLLTGTRLLLKVPLFSRHHHMLYSFFCLSGYLHWCGREREKGTRAWDECSGHTRIVIHWVVLISNVTQGEKRSSKKNLMDILDIPLRIHDE